MKNEYIPFLSQITNVKKHTEIEYTFQMEYNKKDVKPGQFFEISIPKFGEAPISVSGIGENTIDFTIRKVGKVTNEVFNKKGIELPLQSQTTTTIENRLEKGIQAQVDIFGEHMNEAWKKATVNKWLASNCFGDYYTRTGLDLKQREMITFCFLYAQGGCKPQAIAHAKANIRLGNDEAFLIKVVSQNVPFVGYPRSLNAIDCIEKAGKE